MNENTIKAIILDCIETVDRLIDIKNVIINSDNFKLLNNCEGDFIEDIFKNQISTVLKEKIFTFYVCVNFDGDTIKMFFEQLSLTVDNLSMDNNSRNDYNDIIHSSLSSLNDNDTK